MGGRDHRQAKRLSTQMAVALALVLLTPQYIARAGMVRSQAWGGGPDLSSLTAAEPWLRRPA